jgi:hypothetical protein
MASKKSDGPKSKFKVLSHVTHNGDVYGPETDNEVIELTAAEAAPLLADKAIEALANGKAEAPQK